MEHGENQITIVDEEGNEQLFEVLFTFESEEFKKSYVLFTPVGAMDEEDEEGPEIHAYAFNPTDEGGDGELIPIETDEEWDMVEEMLNTFYEEQEDEE
ncbi:DUF1292 domain-containing protein [Neobacillus drentensis]|uniref:DUF1292 domain-containing protein n=1 Tax=Neobacillus TaxID=2675232 RepID=UPI001CBC639E|nr:DUF1292 domain-containing protein [Neobacillus bataviensis]